MSNDKEYIRGLQGRRAGFFREREELMATLKTGQERLQMLTNAINGIDQLLQLEGVRPEPAESVDQGQEPVKDLAEILNMILLDRKFHTVPELVKAAREEGFNFGEKNPLRVVGFTLLGLQRGGDYQRTEDGRWKFIG